MIGRYRLLKTQNGVTSFAAVSIESTPAKNWSVTWNPTMTNLETVYGRSVDAGISAARHEHVSRGGKPYAMEIVALDETVSDTQCDAVECAASIAAWLSWGHDEYDVLLRNADGLWRVEFQR